LFELPLLELPLLEPPELEPLALEPLLRELLALEPLLRELSLSSLSAALLPRDDELLPRAELLPSVESSVELLAEPLEPEPRLELLVLSALPLWSLGELCPELLPPSSSAVTGSSAKAVPAPSTSAPVAAVTARAIRRRRCIKQSSSGCEPHAVRTAVGDARGRQLGDARHGLLLRLEQARRELSPVRGWLPPAPRTTP
jgi:hypothetical protein